MTPGHCQECGTQLAPTLLSCPSCQRLVHAERLKSLAAKADAESQQGNLTAALAHWREASTLLPLGTRQWQAVQERVAGLSAQVPESGPALPAAPPEGSRWKKWATALGPIGLLLWKFKFIVLFALSKAKLVLLGLTKASTFFSMLLSMGLYWTLFGWRFAVGFVLSIYVHEMGHVIALRKFGIAATAPMFIPGLGAVVRLKQYPVTAREDARVGLAGPLWGLGAALACAAAWFVTGYGLWAALARTGAWVNLFNLLPVWQLDGARGFRALSHGQRWLTTGTMAVLWLATGEGLLVLLAIAAAIRTATAKDRPEPDSVALNQFLLLLLTLATLTLLPVPTGQPR